jgi:hypothetical protein
MELFVEVVRAADAVLVIAAMPDFSWGLFAGGERVSAFDELNALGCGLIDGWRDECVDVVGHDDEAVEMKSSALAVRWKWRCCWKVEIVMAYVLCF